MASIYDTLVTRYYAVPANVKLSEKRYQNIADCAKTLNGYEVIDDGNSDGFVAKIGSDDPIMSVEYKSHKTGKHTFITMCKMLTQAIGDIVRRFTYLKNITLKSVLLESPIFSAYAPVKHGVFHKLFTLIKPYTAKVTSSKLWGIKELRDKVKELVKINNPLRHWDNRDIEYCQFLTKASLGC